MNSLIQKKLSHHKTNNINKEWRNCGIDRLMQAEHTFCLTALTIKACVACVDKEGLGNGWRIGEEKGQKTTISQKETAFNKQPSLISLTCNVQAKESYAHISTPCGPIFHILCSLHK